MDRSSNHLELLDWQRLGDTGPVADRGYMADFLPASGSEVGPAQTASFPCRPCA